MSNLANVPILVTAAEASRLLGISSKHVYDLAADGKFEKRYIGKGTRSFRLTYKSLLKYADSLSNDPLPD